MLCDALRCGAALPGVRRRGAVRCGAARRGAVRCGAVRRVRCDALRWCARWRAGAVVRASGPHLRERPCQAAASPSAARRGAARALRRCGAAQCAAVRCGARRCDAAQGGAVWRGAVWRGGVRAAAAVRCPCDPSLVDQLHILRESPGNSERFILGARQLFCTSRKSKIKSSRIRVSGFDADSGPAEAGASAHIPNPLTPIREHIQNHV